MTEKGEHEGHEGKSLRSRRPESENGIQLTIFPRDLLFACSDFVPFVFASRRFLALQNPDCYLDSILLKFLSSNHWGFYLLEEIIL